MLQIKVYSLNQIGKRENLEDCISNPKNSAGIYIVCDGVGGNSFGEIASKLAVECFYDLFSKSKNIDYSFDFFKTDCDKALENFKKQLKIFTEANKTAENASTTLAFCLLIDNKAYMAWSGDSRIYHFRENDFLFISKDHSLVQNLVDQGEISAVAAINHPHKNIITQSLSIKADLEDLEFNEIANISADDKIFLCSDGVLESFNNQELKELFCQKNIDYSVEIEKKCGQESKDNYSMILVDFYENIAIKKKANNLIWVILLAIFGFLLGLFFFKNDDSDEKKLHPTNTKTKESVFIKNLDSTNSK